MDFKWLCHCCWRYCWCAMWTNPDDDVIVQPTKFRKVLIEMLRLCPWSYNGICSHHEPSNLPTNINCIEKWPQNSGGLARGKYCDCYVFQEKTFTFSREILQTFLIDRVIRCPDVFLEEIKSFLCAFLIVTPWI